MKIIKKIFYVITCIFLLNCHPEETLKKKDNNFAYKRLISAKLECMNMPRPLDSYNYPVYPGMPEWANYNTKEEMKTACQIPEEVLKKLSTQAVIQALWEYPFLIDVVHRNQYQMDFDAIGNNNNAYKELTKRKDAGIALLERLLLVCPDNVNVRYEPKAFEILMSQTIFLTQLNNEEKKRLIDVTLKNDELRQQNAELTNLFRETACLLIGKTMFVGNYSSFIQEINQNEQLNDFLNSKAYIYIGNENICEIIVDNAKQFLQQS